MYRLLIKRPEYKEFVPVLRLDSKEAAYLYAANEPTQSIGTVWRIESEDDNEFVEMTVKLVSTKFGEL